ncbi:T9SS type A sorting domain-containing protein [Flavobacterium sp.]|uniref:DUF7619 domain-containing protein n=1 Tax=Flavobacterium sp. TaxID=239 RepID=UPI00286A0071|nr:T9SS type A sorting domain-containing protein [Flavobacterium sp.]
MSKLYIILFTTLFCNILSAQFITFPNATFKSKLLQSDSSNAIARNLSGDYIAIDVNKNGEIELTEALQVGYLEIESSSINSLIGIENFTNLLFLQCSNNQISNLDISNLTSLTDLNCSNNIISTLTLNGAINLQNLYCQSNLLTTLSTNDLINLISIECSDNKITSLELNNLNNLESLACNSNSISSLDLSDLISLLTLECSRNMLTSLDLSLLTNITSLNCNYNLLSTLEATTLVDLNNLNCSNNQLVSLKIDGLTNLTNLNCNFNQLNALNANTLFAITYLNCTNNKLQSIQVTGLINLKVLDFSKNQVTALDTNGLTNLQYLYGNNNKLATLDVTNQTGLQFLLVSNNLLQSIFMKNGSNESSLLFSGNPNLNYICADELDLEYVQEEISNNGYINCTINSYCSFVPGGNYYTIEGLNKLDINNNGCDVLDRNFPNLKWTISDDTTVTTFIPDSTGSYSYGLKEGAYTLTPVLENPAYYTISPASISVKFPNVPSPLSTSFCITPNGNRSDLEIVYVPMDNARTNFESNYQIIYKNKGNVTQSGVISLTFDDLALSFVAANPSVYSQSLGNLNWNFTNLVPQETRTIQVTLRVKPTVNNGYSLNFNTTITNTNDETPTDNSTDLSQAVSSSIILNDKICLEGNTISPSKVGEYLHYMIRFENSGSGIVQNIVVKDLIDISKFDIATLVAGNGSHPFTTKITATNTVEFIFENINLPFSAGSNKGYVVFKIKTIPTLVTGNELSNSATIYFDYKQPIATNTAASRIQLLKVQDYVFSDLIEIYPNPVSDVLNITNKNKIEITSLSIYNTLGQLVQTILNTDQTTQEINVSQLSAGHYFIKINSDNGSGTTRFLKK